MYYLMIRMSVVRSVDGRLFVLKNGKDVSVYDDFAEAVEDYVIGMDKGEPVLNILDVSGEQWVPRAPTVKEILRKRLEVE